MVKPTTPIYFYRVADAYGCFSNFSPHSIALDGEIWPTVEHYYQAQKFSHLPNSPLIAAIRCAPKPEVAAAIGRRHPPRPDWDQLKLGVMERAVRCKFYSYPTLQKVLLATGEAEIIEDSPRDPFWGRGADGQGENHLGKILMRIRQELR